MTSAALPVTDGQKSAVISKTGRPPVSRDDARPISPFDDQKVTIFVIFMKNREITSFVRKGRYTAGF